MKLNLSRGWSPKQLQSIRGSRSRLNIWEGSVRSGKTVASFWRWLAWIRQAAPSGDLLMTGKTTRTLKRNILKPIQDIVGKRRFSYSLTTGEAQFKGRLIYLASANDESSQDKIRGMTLAGAYGDEITLWPESYWTMLLSRLSVGGAKFFGTTNPDSPFHWLKTGYLDRIADLDLSVWTFRLEDNTFLDPAYIAALKAEYTGLWYKRFIDGLWVMAEGAIYDMWDEDRHLIPDNAIPETATDKTVAIDYGTTNPCVFGLWTYDRGTDKAYMEDEYYWDSRALGRQKTDGQYGDDLEQFFSSHGLDKNTWVVVDPSAASFIAEIKKRRFRVKKAKNDVLDGIRDVATRLNDGRLFVCQRCTNTRKEFASYVWDAKAQLRGEDKPVKQMDHSMDQMRYYIRTMLKNSHHGPVKKPKGY